MLHPVQDGARSLNANTMHYIGTERHRNQFHVVVRDKEGNVKARYEDNN
jgi:hypothetical protein